MSERWWLYFTLGLSVVIAIGAPTSLAAQTAISADGAVESTSGGFKFPDGTVQATAARPGSAPVADTGQTLCRDEIGRLRPCAGTGEDGEYQSGVAWPTPRFTDNSDGTVADNLTGLIWLKETKCPGAAGKEWQDALDWVALLNTTAIACTDYTPMTYLDWRLPNIKELLSLVDYGEQSPALQQGHPFLSVMSASHYWSSSSEVGGGSGGWAVTIGYGGGDLFAKGNLFLIWPVRGGQ